jgi:hypothetical protein
MCSRDRQPRLLIVIGCICCAIAGAAFAAEKPATAGEASQPLDFSGAKGPKILMPEQGPAMGNREGLEFLNRRSSVGGVLDGSGGFVVPAPHSRNRESGNDERRQGRIDFEEIWFQGGRPGGGGLTSSDFERAAGLRSAVSGSGTTGSLDSRTPSNPTPTTRSLRPIDQSSGDLGIERLGISPDYGARRSLDPVLDIGLPSQANLGGFDAPGLIGGRPGSTDLEPRGSVRPGLFDPLARDPLNNITSVPRTVRELIDSSPSVGGPERSGLDLDRDTTRDELNPYTPQWREDFQFSQGDSRLGIGPQFGDAANRGWNPLRGQNPRMGPSSLAPALVLPVPDSVATPRRGSREAQFPARRF